MLKWLLIILSYIFLMLVIVGIRKDYSQVANTLQFWLDVFLLFIMGITSAVICFRLSVPGDESKVKFKSIWGALIILVVANVISFFLNRDIYASLESGIFAMCFYEIIFVSVIPAIVLFKVSSSSHLRYHRAVGLSSFLAAASLCAVAVQFSCANSHPFHTLVSHILPVAIFGFIGMWIIKKIKR